MSHWKHRATRCAAPGCERTRKKGWSTCTLMAHYSRGVSLYGLRPGETGWQLTLEETMSDERPDIIDQDQTCRTCRARYPFAGDGWDGECPMCADRLYDREEAEAS